MTYLGVLRNAGAVMDRYDTLEEVQRSRADLATSANSGFGKDVDVSTTSGALSSIPLGVIYLLFAPFPWQLASLRQSITLPEMIVWWASFPMLCAGLWFTLKHRMRQSLPILIFTLMLTLAYSVFQGNIGTAYRQRSQLLIFYFIFVSVGYELMSERREDKRQLQAAAARATATVPYYDGGGAGVVVVPPQPLMFRATDTSVFHERMRAKQEMYAAVRADFLSCEGATEADFERLWPHIRDEIFTQNAFHALARWSPHFALSLPESEAYAMSAGGDGPS
jgi:hypothetical protein